MKRLRLIIINSAHVVTHGLAAVCALLIVTPTAVSLPAILICIFAGLLADIDTSTSFIGRAFPFISKRLETLWGHRQESHTILAAAVVGGAAYAVASLSQRLPASSPYRLVASLWPAAAVGYASHLILDLFNPGGVPLFWPLSQVRAHIFGGRIEQHSVGERLLAFALAAAVAVAAYVQSAGLTHLLHAALPIPSFATELYRDWEGQYAVYADVDGTWQDETHARQSGTYQVLRLDGEVFTLHDPATGRTFTASNVKGVDLYVHTIRLVRGELLFNQPATPTPGPTPTPRLLVVQVPGLTDPAAQVLVHPGDHIQPGVTLAVLPTPLLPTPLLPTPWSPDPLTLALAEAELRVAEAQYRVATSYFPVDPVTVMYAEAQVLQIQAQIASLQIQIAEGAPDTGAIAALQSRLAAAQARLTQLQESGGRGPTAAERALAAAELDRARLVYSATLATPTPGPTPTPIAARSVDALVSGQVLDVYVSQVDPTNNTATVAIVIAVATEPATGGAAPVATEATVERVIDGDTITIRWPSGATADVRLIGVDTPETVHPDRPAQCYGPEASAYVADLLPPGAAVSLEYDRQRLDNYNRTLAYLYLDDGHMLQALLLENGYARTMIIEPNSTHAALFYSLEDQAKAAARGLWGACNNP